MNNKLITTALLFLCSCSGMIKSKINFDASEPLRVAIIPFVQLEDGKFVEDTANVFLIDHIPGLSKESKKGPARLVQDMVVKELSFSNLEVLPSRLVEAEMLHDGYTKNNHIDAEKLYKTEAKEICKTLACDAVLFGEVTSWERSYYGLQSVNNIAFNLKIVRAVDNKTIFTSKVEDSESHGLSQGPTGYTSIILEPLKGLDSEQIEELAAKNVKSALAKLTVKSKADELEIAPYIVTGAHSAYSLNVSRKDPLVVMIYGTPGLSGYFSIGNYIKNIPMKEVTSGHYIGYYLPIEENKFDSEQISVTLISKSNRRISLDIKPGPVSLH